MTSMRCVVTGAAGFIGSHLAERLIEDGHDVTGIDTFTPYYNRRQKSRNIASLCSSPRFSLLEADLVTADLNSALAGCDVVFHLAAQPGVRASWSDGFHDYVACNVVATQRLLEACRELPVSRVVVASSSSVYGNASAYPTKESSVLRPHSPYGVTKLAVEGLVGAYAANFAVPAVSLRYFTVYGPRQRPDMLIHRLIDNCRTGTPAKLFGRGDQIRDFTYVQDAVDATIRAASQTVTPGSAINVAGGSSATLHEVIEHVEAAVGRLLKIERAPEQPGDVSRTGGDISVAREVLGWGPRVALKDGIEKQAEWFREE